jgi:hypothetical protein
VTNLYVDGLDVTADTVFGRADAGTSVDVWVHGGGWLNVTADGSGDWVADFSGMTDLTYFSDGASSQNDNGGDSTLVWWSSPGFAPVAIDIKPGDYPNCLNVNGHGVVPVAILGSMYFNVALIDPGSLTFNGLIVRIRGNGVPQCSIEDVSGDFTNSEGEPDGFYDLMCHFEEDVNLWNPNNGTGTITGNLIDSTPIVGSDSICIEP